MEKGDPQFQVSPRCCVWSGNAWPYATTQTLVALANLLNDYRQDVVDQEDYFELLRTYALSHRRDGRPYIGEASDPFTGSWDGHNTFYHSEHYLHSGFVDLVVTGLVGLRPRADDTLVVNPLAPETWDWFALEGVDYHGHELTILWDRDGSRYGQGAGLGVFVDGREVARSPDLGELRVAIPPAVARVAEPRLHNYAVNNDGSHFPLATASSSLPTAPAFYAVDGNRWYHPSPPNRWVAGGEDPSDWLEIDFGVERPLTHVQLYFLDDVHGPPVEAVGEEATSGFPLPVPAGERPVLPPASYALEMWDGEGWRAIPDQRRSPETATGRRANTVSFPEVRASRVRAVLRHAPGATSGLTEIEAWGPGALPLPEPADPVANLAWNPGDRPWPRVGASFTGPADDAAQAVDGKLSLTRYSRNRWTAYRSPNARDWLEVDLGEEREVGRIELYLYGDGRGVAAPAEYAVEVWTVDGWREAPAVRRIPALPAAWAMNTVELEPVRTTRLRVRFTHQPPAVAGVTEIRVWPR